MEMKLKIERDLKKIVITFYTAMNSPNLFSFYEELRLVCPH